MSRMYRHRVISFQRVVQLIAAALFNGYLIGFQKGKIFTGSTKAFCVPVLNCYSCPGALGACPIGALQTALGGIRHHFPFYVLGLLMLFGITMGRLVCGLLCPFGFVQDLLYKIPLRKRKVPKSIDRPARFLKYIILLVAVILLPAFAITSTKVTPPYFCQYICPAGTLEGGIPLLLTDPMLRTLAGTLFQWKLFVLLIVVIASVVISRPFCRYLCPLGAFYSLFQKFSFFQMDVQKEKCIGCKKCEHICPMEVEVTKEINSPECIRCGACKSVCPTKAICLGIITTFLLTACSNHIDTKEESVQTESGHGEKIESVLGYQLTYEPEIFSLGGAEGMDTYQFVSEDTLNAPVYLAVQRYKDMDADALIEGLILQSGIDGVKAQDTCIGEDNIEAKCIVIEREKYETTWIQAFYAIPRSKGALLVEVSRYTGMPEKAENCLEEMLASFSLKTEE